MSFRDKEINYSELIPTGGVATPKNLSKTFSPYYLEYGLGIMDMKITEAGIKLYKVNGIKGSIYENNQIRYLGNRTWKMLHKFTNNKKL